MTQPISPEQWHAYRAQGYTDAQIMASFHINPTPTLPGPALPGPAAHAPQTSRGNIDDVTGDDAVFRRPKLPPGTRLATVLEIEGPVSTNYGDAVFVGVRDEHGDEYGIKHKYGTAIEQNIARQSLACLVAACGARSLGEIRKGSSRQIRLNAVEVTAKNGQPYVRVDYLSASAPVPTAAAAPSLSLPPMPAPGLPPLPGDAPSLPPLPGAAPALPPLPGASERPPGWMGAWPP